MHHFAALAKGLVLCVTVMRGLWRFSDRYGVCYDVVHVNTHPTDLPFYAHLPAFYDVVHVNIHPTPLPVTAANLSHPIAPWGTLMPMDPPAAFAFLIATSQSLLAAVTTRDNLHLRPCSARKTVAARLRSGMIVLRAFLRRLIILMALDLEWGLVDTRGALKRPHKRPSKSSSGYSLPGLDAAKASPWLNSAGPQFASVFKIADAHRYGAPAEIDMSKLYAQLDFLVKIAANPTAKAKRLAFHLARTYQGIIIAPQGPKRIAGRWGTQVLASFDAMAGSIMTRSRNRPPPLAPPRTHWPTITAI